MRSRLGIRGALLGSATALALAGCGGGDGTPSTAATAQSQLLASAFASNKSDTPTPFKPSKVASRCTPGSDVRGTWKTLVNNASPLPGAVQANFFSYSQPSINTAGLVVFRGRARGEAGGQGVSRGLFALDACAGKKPAPIYTLAYDGMRVPDPNSAGASFNEFPAFPRIDQDNALLVSRGQSGPVWILADGTRVGTAGLYLSSSDGLITAVNQLGSISTFSVMQVPGASTAGVKFDQFPGSPSVADGRYVVFKGNYTDGAAARTGVYFRDMQGSANPVRLIADSTTSIPGGNVPFGSTAPPSAAAGQLAFLGVDNEDAPSSGGIFVAPIAERPALRAVVRIGASTVPDVAGDPLPGAPVFTQLGESLAFDGRYVAFWGAWNTADPARWRERTLSCPSDGSPSLVAACLAQYPSGSTTVRDPLDQGIFVADTVSGTVRQIAQAGETSPFLDFMFWTFSGAAPAGGGSADGDAAADAEPPRWRAASFIALDAQRGVLFKASRQAGAAAAGIYGAAIGSSTPFIVLELGDSMNAIDPAAPAGSVLTALGIEREGLRNGWAAISAGSLNAAGESWGGVYTTYFGGAFTITAGSPLGRLQLGG